MNRSRNYKITVEIEKPMSADRYCECIEVSPDEHEELRPIRMTDIPEMAMAIREDLPATAASKKVDREKFAKYLSRHLTASIIKALEAEDTFNGYPSND